MIISRSIHITASSITLFFLWLRFHCIYVPDLLYPFLFWWTFRCRYYFYNPTILLGETCWLKPPTLTRNYSNRCMSYFMTGSPGKEHGTEKSTQTGRIRGRSKGDAMCPTTSQNSSCLASTLAEQQVHHQEGPCVKMTGHRQPGN